MQEIFNTELGEFVLSNGLVAVLIVFVTYVLYKSKKVLETIHKAVVYAEREYMNESGKSHKKYELALDRLYKNFFLKKYISEQVFDKCVKWLIEKSVKKIDELLVKYNGVV